MVKTVIVTISDDEIGRINEIAQELRQSGMQVDQILSTTGIISGSIESAALRKVRKIPGVASVEEDSEFHAT
jgi:hypothetical protein